MAKYRFRVLAGQHVGPDLTKDAVTRKDPVTGAESTRYPSKTWKQGETVETDTDLASRFGPAQFELLTRSHASDTEEIAELEGRLAELKAKRAPGRTPGDPTPQNLAESPSVAPGGQVSTGFQKAAGPQGSAPMTAEEVERSRQRAEKEAGKGESRAARAEKAEHGTDDLDSLTVVELRDLAAEEEIELHGARSKDDIVAAIKRGRK